MSNNNFVMSLKTTMINIKIYPSTFLATLLPLLIDKKLIIRTIIQKYCFLTIFVF